VGDVYGEDDPRGFSVTFNAGVLVLRPSTAVFEDMKTKIETATYPLKQAEQAFLNLYYAGKGLRLPYVYNANIAIKRRSPVLWESMKDEMRIVHYTIVKPFLDDSRPSDTILTPDEQREAIRLAKATDRGFYAEEVDWWREAYEGMLHDKGTELAGCLRH
jgi:lipopolysaccharide biosynthesis glycosyltransferase